MYKVTYIYRKQGKRNKLIKTLRRLQHQRNYWRNRTKELKRRRLWW